ncbi:methyl-accepting chemotaxis protein [Erwinia sp. E602]|uniref:methyl-accepting chemotaxis protein n=1 Tax=Erwinia sp. E602 TaxID=2675378 RepID=UPI0020111989|nr:methyl-accepting chemotaxis protein [Erwinia sp. E602]
MKNTMSVKKMLTLAFATVILCGVCVSLFAGYKLYNASEQQKLTTARFNDLEVLRGLRDTFSQQLNEVQGLLARNDDSAARTSETFITLQQKNDAVTDMFRGLVNGAKSIPGINLQEVEEASLRLAVIEQTRAAWREKAAALFTYPLADDAARRAWFINQLLPAADSYGKAIGEMVDYQQRVTNATLDSSSRLLAGVFTTLYILTGFSILLGILMTWLITRRLQSQLGGEPAEAVRLATAIAEGDLTTETAIGPGDSSSLMASLAGMQERLRALVAGVKDTAFNVAEVANGISNGNHELASRTEQQASALQQTAASMEQLSATVRNNASGAERAAQDAREAAKSARNGGESAGQMSDAMSGIARSVDKVSEITGVIEGIAFQTNILALNAAVEAARAGESGRGFAVVAGEVRTLAQRSAVAAREIKDVMREATSLVAEGSKVTDATASNIRGIATTVVDLAESIGEISLASGEQMLGISQIHQAVNEMDSVTQKNATLVHTSAAATEKLDEHVSVLTAAVSRFRT